MQDGVAFNIFKDLRVLPGKMNLHFSIIFVKFNNDFSQLISRRESFFLDVANLFGAKIQLAKSHLLRVPQIDLSDWHLLANSFPKCMRE